MIRMMAAPLVGLQLAHQIENLRLQGDVERGGRLVGDQQARVAGQRHRDHHALAHAAGQLVRIFVDAPLGRGDMHPPQQFDRHVCALRRRAAAAVAQNRFDDLIADGEARIERGHRLLKDHRQPIAAQVAFDLVGDVEQIEAIETDRSRHLGRLFRQESHDGKRRDALAAAGFADEAERRASCDGEIDGVDGVRGAPVIAAEGDAQIPDFDQRRVGHCWLSRCGGNAGVDHGAIGDACRVLPAWQIFAKMHPAFAAHRFQPFEFGQTDRCGRRRAGQDRTIRLRRRSKVRPIACRACRRQLASPARMAAIRRRAKGMPMLAT